MEKQQIFEVIVRHSKEILPELAAHDFQITDSLVGLGANSIDRAEIVMMTMEELSLQIPRIELFGARNIGELVDIFYAKQQ